MDDPIDGQQATYPVRLFGSASDTCELRAAAYRGRVSRRSYLAAVACREFPGTATPLRDQSVGAAAYLALAMIKPLRSEWSVREVVEPGSGKIHRIYSYKGKICKRIPLDSQLAKQLAGYVLIEKDLRSAGLWLAEIQKIRGHDALLDERGNRRAPDRERYNIVKALFVAALTFYGKAFAQAEGRRVKLERRQVGSEFQEAHDDAISFRNNFAAHSGAKLLERAQVSIALPPKGKKASPNLYREMDQPDWLMYREGKTFAELFAHVHLIPVRKMAELERKILEDEVLPKGYAYWEKL